jgi:SAM-dependent methyltransferase
MLRDILAEARVYSFFARVIGATRGRKILVQRHIRPQAGDRILDIGCGPADILEALPAVEYYGFDLSADYIEWARKRFGSRGQFHVEMVSTELVRKYTGFDLVLATGVLHHLTDAEAVDLFRVAKAALKPGGRLVTLDGCFIEGQSPVARRLLKWDRGEFVRHEAGYVALARQVFDAVRPFVTTELLRIPYTHLVMECQSDQEDKEGSGSLAKRSAVAAPGEVSPNR